VITEICHTESEICDEYDLETGKIAGKFKCSTGTGTGFK
jgi:hypothetical protein